MNDKFPLVSIIVPMYNAEGTISDCIESLINQLYLNIEIILVDDGSRDNTISKVRKYVEKHKNVKIIQKENGGVSSARNAGLCYANGDFICFVDSDDIVKKSYISSFIENYFENKADLIWCGFERQEKHDDMIVNPKKRIIHDNFEDVFLGYVEGKLGYSSIFNKMFKSQIIFDNNVTFDETLSSSEDMKFIFDYLINCKSISFFDEPNYIYKYQENSITHRFNENQMLNHIRWRDLIEEYKRYFTRKSVSHMLDLKTIEELMAFDNNAIDCKISLSYKKLTQNICVEHLFSTIKIQEIDGLLGKMFYACLKYRILALYEIIYKIRYALG